jgi:hypothetical protein
VAVIVGTDIEEWLGLLRNPHLFVLQVQPLLPSGVVLEPIREDGSTVLLIIDAHSGVAATARPQVEDGVWFVRVWSVAENMAPDATTLALMVAMTGPSVIATTVALSDVSAKLTDLRVHKTGWASHDLWQLLQSTLLLARRRPL